MEVLYFLWEYPFLGVVYSRAFDAGGRILVEEHQYVLPGMREARYSFVPYVDPKIIE